MLELEHKPQVDVFQELRGREKSLDVLNEYCSEAIRPTEETQIGSHELQIAIGQIHSAFHTGQITFEQYLYFRSRYVPSFLDMSMRRRPDELELSPAATVFIQLEAEADFLPPFVDDPSFIPSYGEIVAGRCRVLREQLPALAIDKFLSEPETTYDDYMKFKLKVLSTLLQQSLNKQNPIRERTFSYVSDVFTNWERRESSCLGELNERVEQETGFPFSFLYTVAHATREGDIPYLLQNLRAIRTVQGQATRRIIPFRVDRNREIMNARRAIASRLPIVEDYILAMINSGIWDPTIYKDITDGKELELLSPDGRNYFPDPFSNIYGGEHRTSDASDLRRNSGN